MATSREQREDRTIAVREICRRETYPPYSTMGRPAEANRDKQSFYSCYPLSPRILFPHPRQSAHTDKNHFRAQDCGDTQRVRRSTPDSGAYDSCQTDSGFSSTCASRPRGWVSRDGPTLTDAGSGLIDLIDLCLGSHGNTMVM